MHSLPEVAVEHNPPTLTGRKLSHAWLGDRLKAGAALMNGGALVTGLSARKTAQVVGVDRSLLSFAHQTGMDKQLMKGAVGV